MLDIKNIIAAELSLKMWQVENALTLAKEGGTVPFIARYRKERTGEMDENALRDLFERHEYLTELEERKQTVLKTIGEQGKLTDELRAKIENCLQKTELEDLYLPFKPKKRTKATVAREKGLEPLAEFIKALNRIDAPDTDLLAEAEKYVSAEKEVATAVDALKGAADIIAEEVAETAELRAWLREYMLREGKFISKIKKEFPDGTTKFEMYRKFEIGVKEIPAHTMLALRRGEKEEVLDLSLSFDEEYTLKYLNHKVVMATKPNIVKFYSDLIKDGFDRLMKLSITGEVRLLKKAQSDEESIRVFESNLRQLLLSSPAGMKPTIGIDPGFRTGCKVSVLDDTGKFLEYHSIFPFENNQKADAVSVLKTLIDKYNIELIAIGNGTAGRESDEFVSSLLETLEHKPIKVMVNESGASIYSASKVANEEFPELDLTVRGAISIGRRLQDPLAELVKIDPKSIGVGQYQHDVDQKLLKKKLDDTVVSCVNYVGVDLNTASKELLSYVSGINGGLARSIVEWRNSKGAFRSRKELMNVPKFGQKAFEQSAGFMRIRNGENPLDNTGVHPESYYIVEKMLSDLNCRVADIAINPETSKKLDLNKYIDDKAGLPTVTDIVEELRKSGRDPRDVFKYATFNEGIKEISHLRVGMELEGVVTNITNFGAFVDIGVHQDGLVHVSEMANRFVRNPAEVVKVGQIVKVTVLEIKESLKRVSLSMKTSKELEMRKQVTEFNKKKEASLTDLRNKFI
ncbi:MAG: RNA-binding protein [Ignavibacteria bacterium]|nr:RNA-binding protein [Ignavibacteria bacterium]